MMGRAGPKLIGMGKSRAFRCLWALEELGIPYRYVPVMPQSEEAKHHNPLGKIPILVEEDGFCIYETTAIINYLCDKHRSSGSNNDDNNLIPPSGTKERGLYEQTMSVLVMELDTQGLWIHRKHEAMGEYFGHIPDAVEHARKYFNKTNRMLIQQLKNSGGANTAAADGTTDSYLLGANFTAADIVYVHCLDWSKIIGWDAKWKDDVALTKYIKRCKSREAFSRTIAKIKGDKKSRTDRSNL
jgi:glutathione S-transferase